MVETITKQNLKKRPPIIVVLGHIDHGKTTLLDYIRKSHVAEKEEGGITQHIGAYEIEFNDQKITFIDTPGHEAFSAMRQRGAKVADIALLVIDSVEGVKIQTKEALDHIKKVNLPMIVVLNKIDKQGANPIKVKQQLAELGVLVEGFGGDIPVAEVSAKTGQGVNDLLEIILLLAEMIELKADYQKTAEGVVIESFLDKRRGPTATLLIRDGVLRKGDIIATPSAYAKVRILENFQRKIIQEAFPSMPAVVLGFNEVPRVGESFKAFPDLESAEAYVEKKEKKRKEILTEILDSDKKILNVILKADAVGTLEALEDVIKRLPQELVLVRLLKAEVGDINESDAKLASSGKAVIIGFRVGIDALARKLIEREKLRVFKFNIIYDLIQKVRELMNELLEPQIIKRLLGKMEVLVVFRKIDKGQIIGCRVVEGVVKKGAKVDIYREEKIIDSGIILNLQKNKIDVEEAKEGEEVGILYSGQKNPKIKVGDRFEVYEEEKIEQKI